MNFYGVMGRLMVVASVGFGLLFVLDKEYFKPEITEWLTFITLGVVSISLLLGLAITLGEIVVQAIIRMVNR